MLDSKPYWQSADEDAVMQEEHVFMWRAMLATIESDLTGRRVLDVGCNRGGFLRLLADEAGIAAGDGFDPASGAIADARRLTGEEPLRFEVADTVPAGWAGYEVAFSHEVLYLLPDLSAHAIAIDRALAPGGVYYAVEGVHAGSPRMAEWHARNAKQLALPPLYTLDDISGAFAATGFTVAAARLKIGFVPVSGHTPTLDAGLEYFYEHKVMFKFEKAP
jgi:SAM-dependent methyltransferase